MASYSIRILVACVLPLYCINTYAQESGPAVAVVPLGDTMFVIPTGGGSAGSGGDGGGSGSGGCEGFCGGETGKKLVFVTNETFTGSIGALVGLAGADAQCQFIADEANLKGSYFAWLATDSMYEPSDRLSDTAGSYHLKDGTLVATNKAMLVSNIILAPINQTAYGSLTTTTTVWTGIPRDYANGPQTCESWTTDSYLRRGGLGTVSIGAWTKNNGTQRCSLEFGLYCFEK